MRLLPEPGTRASARLVTGLTIAAVLIALWGVTTAIAAPLTGGGIQDAVTGALQALVGVAFVHVTRAMARTERVLAQAKRAIADLERDAEDEAARHG